jgi:hypothetical protein
MKQITVMLGSSPYSGQDAVHLSRAELKTDASTALHRLVDQGARRHQVRSFSPGSAGKI